MAGSLARGDLDLNLFTAEAAVKYGARCLDGSPAGFYFKRGVESNKWVFFLEGKANHGLLGFVSIAWLFSCA